MNSERKYLSSTDQEFVDCENSFYNFLIVLLKKWWLFLIVCGLSGIAGIYYASKQPINFKSKLTFALDDRDNGGLSGYLNLANQFGINIGSGKDIFAGDNITTIMKSRRMIERVFLSVDTFENKTSTLIQYYLSHSEEEGSRLKPELKFPVGQARSSFSYQQDSVLFSTYQLFIKNNIDADRPDKKLSIYEVNVITPFEKFTKIFTERLVAETNSFYIEMRTKKAKQTLEILEKRVSEMKGNLNSSISQKAQIQDKNINPAFSEADIPIIKQQSNIQVFSAAYGEMFKALELARFQYLNQIPLMQIIDHADYPMKKEKVGKLKTGFIWALVAGFILALIFWAIRFINFPVESLRQKKV